LMKLKIRLIALIVFALLRLVLYGLVPSMTTG
jgi:hypothetical protein